MIQWTQITSITDILSWARYPIPWHPAEVVPKLISKNVIIIQQIQINTASKVLVDKDLNSCIIRWLSQLIWRRIQSEISHIEGKTMNCYEKKHEEGMVSEQNKEERVEF